MSGLILVPWNDAGPRLLNVARPFSLVMAPTVKDSAYWAGGPLIPTVWQAGPSFPAATTGTMPAALTSCTAVRRTDWSGHSPRGIEHNQELFTATGAFEGSGLFPSRSKGATMNSRHPM